VWSSCISADEREVWQSAPLSLKAEVLRIREFFALAGECAAPAQAARAL
jgi:hypothetical protein